MRLLQLVDIGIACWQYFLIMNNIVSCTIHFNNWSLRDLL